MSRAAPTAPTLAPFEIALTCRKTCATWFLELHPGTDAAAWIAEHTRQPAGKATAPTPTKRAAVLDSIHGHLMRSIYQALADKPGTCHEVAARIGRQRSSVSGRLSEMVNAGLLVRADGVYRVKP